MNTPALNPGVKHPWARWGVLGLIGFLGLLAAGLIIGLFFPDSSVAWKCLGMCISTLCHAAVARLVWSNMRRKYPGWYSLVRLGWCGMSALLWLAIIWDVWNYGFDLLEIVVVIWVGLIVSDPFARMLTHGRDRIGSILGLAAAGAFMLVGTYTALDLYLSNIPEAYKLFASLFLLAFGMALRSAILLIATGPMDRRWTIHVPAWLMLLCALVATALVWLEGSLGDDLVSRLALATGFVAVASLAPAAVALLTGRQARTDGATGASTRRPSISLICPRCRVSFEATTGSSGCPSCRTEFRIEVRPEVCLMCGYSMTGVGPVCPECGANHAA